MTTFQNRNIFFLKKLILSEGKKTSRLLKVNVFIFVAVHEALIQFKVYSHKLYYVVRNHAFKSKVTFSDFQEFFWRRTLTPKRIFIVLNFLPFLQEARMTGEPLQEVSVQSHIWYRTQSSQVCKKSWGWMKTFRKQQVNYLSWRFWSPAVAFSNPPISLNKTASIPWGNIDKNNWQHAPASIGKGNTYPYQGEL